MQHLAVAARDKSERKESSGRMFLLIRRGARRRCGAVLSLTTRSPRSSFSTGRARFHPAALRFTPPWRRRRRLRFPPPGSLSHAGTSIPSPPLVLSQPLSLTPCRCPASIRADPGRSTSSLFLRASLRCPRRPFECVSLQREAISARYRISHCRL